ncbi:hypothetical protein ACROYT_G002391, partial [Oculina patagonica]
GCIDSVKFFEYLSLCVNNMNFANTCTVCVHKQDDDLIDKRIYRRTSKNEVTVFNCLYIFLLRVRVLDLILYTRTDTCLPRTARTGIRCLSECLMISCLTIKKHSWL